MSKWRRGSRSTYVGIYDAFALLRLANVELRSTGDMTVEEVLDYAETIVNDSPLWQQLPERIRGVSTAGLRADLEGILAECKMPPPAD